MADLPQLKKKYCKLCAQIRFLSFYLYMNLISLRFTRDVTLPIKISTDDNPTSQWIDGLNSLIALSKVTARVIKFNYCPPPPFIIQGPVKVYISIHIKRG